MINFQLKSVMHIYLWNNRLTTVPMQDRGTINQRDRQPEKGKPEVVETIPEITEPTPEEKPKSTNMLPAILTLIVLACGGGFFVFKKVQKKAQEVAKPDPDADYVDDDEDYGYDPEFEDDDADSSVDEDDNEPV